jgi:hypothetical protein
VAVAESAMDDRTNPPQAKHSPNTGLRLDNIAEDVQYLIVAELVSASPTSVLALAQSSHALRQATLPFVYRNVVLCKGNENSKAVNTYERLVEQFRAQGECNIARHVRNLAVKDELPTADLWMILDRISKLGILRTLR